MSRTIGTGHSSPLGGSVSASHLTGSQVERHPQRQTRLSALGLVPVGVGDHDSARHGTPAPPPAEWKWLSASRRHDPAPADVDHASRSRLVRSHLGIRLHGQDPGAAHGHRPRPRRRVIQNGDHVAVDENRLGGPDAPGPRREADGRQTARQHRNEVDKLTSPTSRDLRPPSATRRPAASQRPIEAAAGCRGPAGKIEHSMSVSSSLQG